MKYTVLILIIGGLFSGHSQNYQDSILFLNGKTLRGNIINEANGLITINVFKKEGKPDREINLETYRIFSYHQNEKEIVIYKKDASPDNFLTQNQAKRFALGGYDAYNFYDTKSSFYTAAGIAFGLILFDTYLTKSNRNAIGNSSLKLGFFGKSPGVWPLASILVLPISFGLPSTKIRAKHLQNGVRGDEVYYAGFNDMAKQKRTMSSLKGTFAGLVLGYVSYGFLRTNDF